MHTTYTRTYISTRANIFVCLHSHTYNITLIHTYIHTYIHTFIHTYIHTNVHTNIHKYIHAYIHTPNDTDKTSHLTFNFTDNVPIQQPFFVVCGLVVPSTIRSPLVEGSFPNRTIANIPVKICC